MECQLRCGCCYAFATLALYEWAYCRAKNQLIQFSKQYPVDCGDPKRYLYGCSGGSQMYLREFVLNNGLLRDHEHPFMGMQLQCPYPSSVQPLHRGSIRIYDQGWEVISLATVEEKLKLAPVVVIVTTNPSCSKLHEYGGGVDNDINCSGSTDSSHVMLLVGSGRENGYEYFLIRNSWGHQWGEGGYYKMNNKHQSVIDNEGLVIKFASVPVIDETVYGEDLSVKAQRNYEMILEYIVPHELGMVPKS